MFTRLSGLVGFWALGLLALSPMCAASLPVGAAAGSYVVLTDLEPDDPYFPAVERLRTYRSGQLIRFPTGRVAEALAALRATAPDYVGIVVRPETLEVNFALEVLELSTRLDADPFVDFAYGFITGATAADALGLVERTIRAEGEAVPDAPRLFAFGPTSTPQADQGNSFAWLAGWRCNRLEHEPGRFPAERLPELATADVIRFWGHGDPEGVDGGLVQADLATLQLDARIVFAGPCFSAVTRHYFDEPSCGKPLEARSVEPGKSLALTFLAKGAVAYFGSLQEDRCIAAGQEMEYALTSGAAVGMVLKHMQDRIALSSPEGAMHFSPLEAGQPAPAEKGIQVQLRLAAGRVLVGDPAFVPFPRQSVPAVTADVLEFPIGLVVEATIVEPRIRSLFVNAFRDDLCTCNTDNDTLHLRVPLPEDNRVVVRAERVALAPALEKAKRGVVQWREERWSGRRYLHLQLDFKHDTFAEIAPGTTVAIEVDTACTCRPAE